LFYGAGGRLDSSILMIAAGYEEALARLIEIDGQEAALDLCFTPRTGLFPFNEAPPVQIGLKKGCGHLSLFQVAVPD